MSTDLTHRDTNTLNVGIRGVRKSIAEANATMDRIDAHMAAINLRVRVLLDARAARRTAARVDTASQ